MESSGGQKGRDFTVAMRRTTILSTKPSSKSNTSHEPEREHPALSCQSSSSSLSCSSSSGGLRAGSFTLTPKLIKGLAVTGQGTHKANILNYPECDAGTIV